MLIPIACHWIDSLLLFYLDFDLDAKWIVLAALPLYRCVVCVFVFMCVSLSLSVTTTTKTNELHENCVLWKLRLCESSSDRFFLSPFHLVFRRSPVLPCQCICLFGPFNLIPFCHPTTHWMNTRTRATRRTFEWCDLVPIAQNCNCYYKCNTNDESSEEQGRQTQENTPSSNILCITCI